MADCMDASAEADEFTRKYDRLREQAARLWSQREEVEFFDRHKVAESVAELDGEVKGRLFVFVARGSE